MKGISIFLILKFTVMNVELVYTCTSLDCTAFVNSMKNSMNHKADPCTDFYEYACGKWEEYNPIPKDENHWTVMHILQKDKTEKLIGLLNGTTIPLNPTHAFHKVKKLYETCTDVETIEKNGVEAILSQFNKNGRWPAIMNSHNWTPDVKLFHEMHKYYVTTLGLSLFYGMSVHPQMKYPFINAFWIDQQPGAQFVGFLRRTPRKSPGALEYFMIINKIIDFLVSETDGNVDMKNLRNDIVHLINFQRALTRLISSQRENKKLELMTIDGFQEWFDNNSENDKSKIVWLDFLQSLFSHHGINVNGNFIIRIRDMEFIKGVMKLIEVTPLRTLVNYIQWSFLEEMIPYGPKKLRDFASELHELKGRPKITNDRSKFCLSLIELNHALNYEYVKLYFPQKNKRLVHNTLSKIVNSMDKSLSQTPWLKSDEKRIIHDKLFNMKYHIGYPHWYDESSAIDDYFKMWNITDDYMENIIEFEKFKWQYSLSQLGHKRKSLFSARATEIIGDYGDYDHSVRATAAFLQNPLFSQDRPSVFQYATFGSIMGHELSHAFDETGSQFDENGFMKNWWSQETKHEFDSKVKCFVNQYSQYKMWDTVVEKIYVDAEKTKDENIADLHGLKFAYKAYQNVKTPEDDNLQLSGLESFSSDQLFFLGYTNIFCSAIKPNVKEYRYLRTHSLYPTSKFRVIGSLSNMKEFSDAFNCPVESPMNPDNKCGIWNIYN